MSMTAVPISIVFVRAPTAARSGNGEPSWRAKWCTRKYAPSRPSPSAATASSIDCRRASDAVRTSEYGAGVQWPKERKPIFFTQGTSERRPHQTGDLWKRRQQLSSDEGGRSSMPRREFIQCGERVVRQAEGGGCHVLSKMRHRRRARDKENV